MFFEKVPHITFANSFILRSNSFLSISYFLSLTLVSPVSRDQSRGLSITIVLRYFCDTGMSKWDVGIYFTWEFFEITITCTCIKKMIHHLPYYSRVNGLRKLLKCCKIYMYKLFNFCSQLYIWAHALVWENCKIVYIIYTY